MTETAAATEPETCVPWYESASIPALLRHARTAYGSAMRKALEEAGYGDVPANGLYVIGGMAREEGSYSLTELVDQLGVSKQAAGQLVDTLVLRGYLERKVDEEDRRKISITLTPRGLAAAEAQSAGRALMDNALTDCVGPASVLEMRRALAVLCAIGRGEIGHPPEPATADAPRAFTNSTAPRAFTNQRLDDVVFDNCRMKNARFNNVNLSGASLADVNLSGATIDNVNLSGARITDANIRGLTIAGFDIQQLVGGAGTRQGRG